MNAPTQIILPAPPAHVDDPGSHDFTPNRYDGWTPERQRIFLEAISEGHSVTHACHIVGLSKQSAYAFRNRTQGGAFAIGWQAAQLLGRTALADELMDRVIHGVTDTVTYRNGETLTRHRHDNRLAMAMLTRMDRAADAARGEAGHAAARLVAAEFDQFLDMLGRDGGPARAGLFLGARAEEATPDDLAPIRALARADKWLRTHADAEIDTSDLDPAARAGWTAEQWARAEAAGLLVLAPAPPPEPEPEDSRDGNGQLGQPNPDDGGICPVWWSEEHLEWRTWFPPPDGFRGHEDGDYGDHDYERALSPAEQAVLDARDRAEVEQCRAEEIPERDAWFGFSPAAAGPQSPAARTRAPGPGGG